MQEEEKNAVTPTEAAETPEQPERSIAEEPAEGSETADAAETAAEDTAEISETAPEEVPAEPEDKIRAIRTSLFHIAQEEEEEAVTQRVAQQIQQVKDQKEHPEKYPPPPMPPKPRKQTFGQKMLGLFPQRGDSGGEVVRKSIFLFSATVFLVCMVLIVLYFVDIFRADKLYEDIGSNYHANQSVQTTTAVQETQPAAEEPTEKIYTLLPGAADLLAMNSEINGWISIPDTKVDYPVLHHLDDEPGNEYYLYRNVQKEDSKPGSIFLDYRCTFDDVGEDGTLPHFLPERRGRLLLALSNMGEPDDVMIDTRLFGHVIIDPEKCTSCQMCATFCPTEAIHKFGDAATAAETGKPFGIDHYTGRCVQCRCCEDICPTGALTLSTDVFAADVTKRGRSERIPMKPRARKVNDPKSIVNAMSALLNVPNVYER